MTLSATRRTIGSRMGGILKYKTFYIGLVVVFVAVSSAVLAPVLATYPAGAVNLVDAYLPPGSGHWMGTDQLGRDIYSQLLYGGRTSLFVGITSATISTVIGVVLGGVAGYFGRAVDSMLLRFSEIVMAFPNLILVLILVSFVGSSVGNLVAVFALTGWIGTFRIVRGEFMSLKHETFVDAARTLGYPHRLLIFREILPNVMSPILVAVSIQVSNVILAEAGLSFLGLGVPVTTPTWGNMIAAAQSPDVLRNYWWIWAIPGVVVCVFSIAVTFVADGVRDVLDPQGVR